MAAKKKEKEEPKSEAPIVEGPKKPDIQIFKMIRNSDDSGISGTGCIAKGIVWEDGSVHINWTGVTPCHTRWDTFEMFTWTL